MRKLPKRLAGRSRAGFLAATLWLLAFSAPASGAVIFSSFGDGRTFNTTIQPAVWGSAFAASIGSHSPPREVSTAVEFQAEYDYALSEINLPLFLFGGTNAVDVSLWSSVNRLPGIEIRSWSVSALEPYYTGGQVLSGPLVTIPVYGDLTLSAGTSYYLMASPGAPDTNAGWAIGPDRATDINYAQNGSGVWRRAYADGNLGYAPAFDLVGTVVPLPAGVWMLLSGLGSIGAFRRRLQDRQIAAF